MNNYKQKYDKYKNKYLNYKKNIYGGELYNMNGDSIEDLYKYLKEKKKMFFKIIEDDKQILYGSIDQDGIIKIIRERTDEEEDYPYSTVDLKELEDISKTITEIINRNNGKQKTIVVENIIQLDDDNNNILIKIDNSFSDFIVSLVNYITKGSIPFATNNVINEQYKFRYLFEFFDNYDEIISCLMNQIVRMANNMDKPNPNAESILRSRILNRYPIKENPGSYILSFP
jgi:hypothetical protein